MCPGGVGVHKLLDEEGGKGVRSGCRNRLTDEVVHDPAIVKLRLGVQGAKEFQELDEQWFQKSAADILYLTHELQCDRSYDAFSKWFRLVVLHRNVGVVVY